MLSDLDAIDDALANAGARIASKFRPKVGKLKAVKPFAAVHNVDSCMPRELVSVSQTDSQLPTSQVGATLGVRSNGAMVAMYQSNKENQGKQTLGSSLEASYIGAGASFGIENAGESSIFSIMHGTVSDVDTVTGGVTDVSGCLSNGPNTANQEENEHFTSSTVVCNVHSDTYSNQVGNVERNSMSFYSQQDAYDTELEIGEANAPDQAVGSCMNDELLRDDEKDKIFYLPGLDGETSRETRSLRRTRKRKNAFPSSLNETNVESKDEAAGTACESSDSVEMDESGSDVDFSEGNTVKQQRVAKSKSRLPKEPKPKNQPKSKQKTKANEGSNSSKKEPKKKFSHSTRRTRKLMDETLLETPEDDINPRTLILKDLILLAEMKEKKLNKAAAAVSSVAPERDAAGFQGVAMDGTFQCRSPSLNGDGDDINQTDEPTRPKLNYHSYMKRPSHRWSNADTELFYKALRQFGTDFEMIQKLFPGRTRHQVKLKYKKEERKHPLQLADALVHRSKVGD